MGHAYSFVVPTLQYYHTVDNSMLSNCVIPSGFSTATGYPARPPESSKGAAGLSQN